MENLKTTDKMKKTIGTLLLGATLLTSCQPNKQDSVKDLLSATNNFDKQKIGNLLADDFVFTDPNGTKSNKQDYINKLDTLENFETRQSVVSIQDLDSVLKTQERTVNILDSVLEITPKMVQYKTYKVKDGKISSISLDSIANLDEYNKSLTDKIMPFGFWVEDTHDVELSEVMQNLKKYLTEYQQLSVSDKKKFGTYSRLQGTYISKDNPFYRKLVFKGKTTVTIIDAIFGFPFTSSYVLDENYIRIRTDKSDLLLEVKNNNTLVGEGFASGTFKRKE